MISKSDNCSKEGIDYNEVFSPVVKHTSIRILLALVAEYDLELAQFHVKIAFLHGDLEEEIYMTQPCGFKVARKANQALTRLAKNYANPLSSRTIGLTEQLTLISRGSQPVVEYLTTIHDIADELALIGAPVPNQYLITHTFNGVGPVFKELAATVRVRDTMINFDELHDKLVEYESFLKREKLRSTGNLGNITANATHFSS
ncbi:hypothetical protein WN943_001373 [Citrus x changshan-huyou]